MNKYKVMTFGLGGNHAECVNERGNSYTSSWYLSPEELQIYIGEHYIPEEIEGCILVDICQLVYEKPSLALSCPLCDPLLKDDEVNEFNKEYLENPVTKAIMSEFSTGGGGLAVASAFVGGLDKVSVSRYVNWWKEKGARIGKVKDGIVTWKRNWYGQNELFEKER